MKKHSLIEEVQNLRRENEILKDELLSLKALLFLRDKVDEQITKIVANNR
jgi:hypothetical protein